MFFAVITTAILFIFYMAVGFAIRDRWKHKIVFNPLKIIANDSGRASLSSAQIFFFALIVLWLEIYWVLQEGTLIPINDSILILLGITIVGSGTGKLSDSARFRATAENWAWAKKKKWIEKNFSRSSIKRIPKFGDLLTNEQGFDIARFQTVGFSLLIGVALAYSGITAEDGKGFSEFAIDDGFLALIGISQGAYVGGKFVGGNLYRELNEMLDNLRKLEIKFMQAVVNSTEWRNESVETRNMKLASSICAVNEYVEYIKVAEGTSEIVENLTGNFIQKQHIEPSLPE